MTIKERIFNNLSERNKVELSVQKVELGLIDDLEKINSSYLKETDTANSIIKGLLSDARKVESRIESALKNSNKMPSLISSVEKSAKEIGIDVNNIKGLKTAKLLVKESKEYSNALSVIKKFISSI